MPDWKKSLITPDASILDAIETIQSSPQQICLVVDKDRRLLGTVTDGDVRRGLLKSMDVTVAVDQVMNTEPHVAPEDAHDDTLLAMMKEGELRQIPLIDDDKRVVGLIHIYDLISPPQVHDNWVVLMAGGMGTRLRPLTEDTPKPLLSVGDKPILETIMDSFIEQNFSKFYISVNYRAKAIKKHFGDGAKWNVDIHYLEEEHQLGTAGALQLVSHRPDLPMLVMNGDLLTRVNFHDLLNYHHEHDSQATMCVREYDFKVPFGVVEIANNRVLNIDEKPVHRFFVNAGIYVIDPALIDMIPAGEHFDMPQLFEKAIEAKCPTAAFPIYEYWIDVGRIDDLDRAKSDYEENFNGRGNALKERP
jgi:dTDP-glucose pyrophosphorylase